MRFERERRVLLSHRHELALLPALGRDALDLSASSLPEPFGNQLLLRHLDRKQQLGGRDHVLRVELTDERRKDCPIAPAADLVEEERLAAKQPPFSNKEELHAGVPSLA